MGTYFLQKEDGDFLLQENGDKLILEFSRQTRGNRSVPRHPRTLARERRFPQAFGGTSNWLGDGLRHTGDGVLTLALDTTVLTLDADGELTIGAIDTKGDLLVFGSRITSLPVGSNDQVLVADSTAASGLKWAAAPTAAHGSTHVTGAADEIDGDKLDIDWNPTNYTPTTSPTEADSVDNLTAHLAGIDTALADEALTFLDLGAPTELTISAGAVTITKSYHTVDTEADAASDDLDTINGTQDGRILILRAESGTRTVVIKNNTGNILTRDGADFSLDDVKDRFMCQYDAGAVKWIEVPR